MDVPPLTGRCGPAPRATWVRAAALAWLALVASASPVLGQAFETVGTRALGMGGAFVAVADDATAAYWNPAGLANSGIVDSTVQRTATQAPFGQGGVPAERGGWRSSTTFFGFAIPSLGVSYLRLRFAAAPGSTGAQNHSRQHDRPGMAAVSSLATDQVGVTLLQSLLPSLVVGTTLKLARGSSAILDPAPGTSLSAALDQVAAIPSSVATRFDLDVGVLAFAGPVRAGLVGRNLRRPDFGGGNEAIGRLPRQVRAGIAFTPGFVVNRTAAGQPSLTIAVDADLTRSSLSGSDERHVAAGVERWFLGRRVGVRGGVRANTIGDSRPLATAGASIAFRRGALIEGQFARGGADAGQQWSIGARVTF